MSCSNPGMFKEYNFLSKAYKTGTSSIRNGIWEGKG